MSQEQEKTNVNQTMVDVPQQGYVNPYDDALAFRSLLGAVHGEFNHMVNDNMVSETSTLKKINGREILEKGVKELLGQAKPVNQIPPQIQQQPQQTPVAAPVSTPQPPPLPQKDDNQLELNFDKSATVNEIFNKLEDLEIKLDNLTKLFESSISNKKKTVVKK